MGRLVWVFTGHTYSIVGTALPLLKCMLLTLTLKAPSKSCSRQHSKFFFFFFFSVKTSLDISCESSSKQTIHMKFQDLFSLKNRKKKKKILSSAAVVIGALRVKALTRTAAEDIYVLPPMARGNFIFGADPVGVNVGITLSCLHNILWTNGWILAKFSWIYNLDVTKKRLDLVTLT